MMTDVKQAILDKVRREDHVSFVEIMRLDGARAITKSCRQT
jgi:hypothetical protein